MLTENIAIETAAISAIAAPATTPDSRAEINRQNAQASTGPRTPEGKNRVRLNALRHGLYSNDAVAPGENLAEYEALGLQLRADFSPRTSEEVQLVQTLQDARWRIQRNNALETRMYSYCGAEEVGSIEEQFGELDPATLVALSSAAGYRANSRIFEQIQRQEHRLRRLIEVTVRDLHQRLAIRPPAPAVQSVAPAPRPAVIPAPEPRKSEAGFVPSISATAAELPASPAPAAPKMPHFSGPQAKEHRKNWLRKQRKLGNIS